MSSLLNGHQLIAYEVVAERVSKYVHCAYKIGKRNDQAHKSCL